MTPSPQRPPLSCRSMEGGCAKVFGPATKVSEFPPWELPMDRPEWKGNMNKNHPLCDMPADFVAATLAMHNKVRPYLAPM